MVAKPNALQTVISNFVCMVRVEIDPSIRFRYRYLVFRARAPARTLFAMLVREPVRCAENLFDPANYYIYLFVVIMHTHEAIRFQCGKSVRMCVYTLES